jgi:hypothetical protein
MNTTKHILHLILIILFASCKKNDVLTVPLASLNVTNAIFGGSSVKLGSYAANISNNNYVQFGLSEGNNDVYVWPIGDSAHPYYTYSKLNVYRTESYSLFLTGVPSAVVGVLVKDNITYKTDSSFGIRFINLAPNIAAVSINQANNTTGSEVENLSYKSYTDFKTYRPFSPLSVLTFEIRNAANGSLLAVYKFGPSPAVSPANIAPITANITLVIRQNGSTGVTVFRVNNDR